MHCTAAILAGLTFVWGVGSVQNAPCYGDNTSEAAPRWFTDYSEAVVRATGERKMLFIYFNSERDEEAERRFESETLEDAEIGKRLSDYVLLRLSMSATVQTEDRSMRLIDHASFRYMYGMNGVAVIDYKHEGEPHYGRLVSCFPFEPPALYCPAYESIASLKVILELPPGTITQRTMVYAVRMHPEGPRSTSGSADPVLLSEARDHSRYQARTQLLGHDGWQERAQRIMAHLGGAGNVSEVCAESRGQPKLVPACLDCVRAWRQSPAHWSSVSAPQSVFGYDIRRGSNGAWYATGVFGG